MSEATALSKHRKEKLPVLVHLVCDDLDWIVMNCLEKDRARAAEARAERSEWATVQRAYAADIYLAQHALATGDFGRVHRLLNFWEGALNTWTNQPRLVGVALPVATLPRRSSGHSGPGSGMVNFGERIV